MKRWKNNPKSARKLLITMIATAVLLGSLTAAVMAKSNGEVAEIMIGVTGEPASQPSGGEADKPMVYDEEDNIRGTGESISGNGFCARWKGGC